jgi:hypothetical protein
MITCIEIQGTFGLDDNLPAVREGDWVGSARQTDGLTIFGTGDDTIDGNGWLGPQITLVGSTPVPPAPNNAPATLNVSDLTLTDFENGNGAAIYVYLNNQSIDAEVTLNNVTVADSVSTFAGAAVYVVSRTSDVYLSVTDSESTNNASQIGGLSTLLETTRHWWISVHRPSFAMRQSTSVGPSTQSPFRGFQLSR